MVERTAAEKIGATVILIVVVSIVTILFLDTANPIVQSADVRAGGPLENLTTTGKTIGSFLPVLYVALPLVFIGVLISVVSIKGKKIIGK